MVIVLTEDYAVAPDGFTVTKYPKGAEVDGRVAEMAMKAGKARKTTPKPMYKKPAPKPDEEG